MVDVEEVTDTAPRPAGRTLFSQGWRDVAFVHWAADPAVVAPLLPPGTRPDTTPDGRTWVGLVPFRMRRIGVLGSPGLPWVGSFLETNVRLYSVDASGRRGVVFRSLDADRLLPVLVARAAGLPYLWSRMRFDRDGDRLTYTSRRRWPGARGTGGRVVVRVGARLPDPGPLAGFLTGRWGLHQTASGRLAYWPNEHPAWPLHSAELLSWDGDLLAAAGLPGIGGPPDSVLFSPGVDVRFGPRL